MANVQDNAKNTATGPAGNIKVGPAGNTESAVAPKTTAAPGPSATGPAAPAAGPGVSQATPAAKATRKKLKRTITDGQSHIHASFNNTIVTITDAAGNTLSWSSAAACGYKGSRKSTPFAAGEAATQAVQKAINDYGLKSADVFVKGPGPGREAAIRALGALIKLRSITDETGVPFNGCRAAKKRRV